MKRFSIILSHRFFIVTFLLSILFSISMVLESHASLLEQEWKYGIYGTGIGETGISVFDIDNDGTLEMVMGGSTKLFGSDNFWYVVKQSGPDTYEQVWLSDQYSADVNRIAVADVDDDGIGEIYVGLSDGTVHVYDGLTFEEIGSFTAGNEVGALVVADVDADGDYEIITNDCESLVCSNSKIYVHSALTFAQEWVSPGNYGGSSLAVGNVDADPAPEIVTTFTYGHGYVIDGISRTLEWDYSNGFGWLVELGDVDTDGIDEIIGADRWYKITIFDADIQTPSWMITTAHDISALHVEDTDGDSIPEILYGDHQHGKVHCYDGITQAERWSIPNPEAGVTDIALGDVNNDGVLEVIWGGGSNSTGPDYLFIADVITQLIEWQNIHLDGPLSAVDVGDVDDDGQDEIVMVSFESESGYDVGIVHIFDATTHELEWRSALGIMDWMGVRAVKIGDVDDDGETEFVITTADIYSGIIQIYDGKTHVLERQSAGYNGAYFTTLEIGDVDNDGQTEIVAGQGRETTGAPGVSLVVFDGATAIEEWKSGVLGPYNGWFDVYDIVLADIDNDGNTEIIASLITKSYYEGLQVYVYDGFTHQLDWSKTVPAFALEVFDVDSDGEDEILIGEENGIVEVYDGSTFTLEASYKIGDKRVTGLLVDDIDEDGSYEWLVVYNEGEFYMDYVARLSVFSGGTKELIWQSNILGSRVGNFNNINSRDIDNDGLKEIVLGSYHAIYQFGIQEIPATVRIELKTLNLASQGMFTAFITLPEGYDAADIDINTVECEGVPAVRGMISGNTLIVKFYRQDMVDVPTGGAVALEVTGQVNYNGNLVDFRGSDTIRVIDKGKK